MRPANDAVKNQIEKISKACIQFSEISLPNESISGHDFELTRKFIALIPGKLRLGTKHDLIGVSETIVRQLDVPSVEYDGLDYGVIKYRSQIYDVIAEIGLLIRLARMNGYSDPYAVYVNTNDQEVERLLSKVIRELETSNELTQELIAASKKSPLSGIQISAGFIKVEASVLKKVIAGALNHARVKPYIDAASLREKIQDAQEKSKKMLNDVVSNRETIGEKILNITAQIAKATTDALQNTLILMRDALNRKNKTTKDLRTSEEAAVGIIKNVFLKLMRDGIIGRAELLEKIPSHTSVSILNQGQRTISFETTYQKAKYHSDGRLKEDKAVITAKIGTEDYNALQSIGATRLSQLSVSVYMDLSRG